MNDHYVPPPPPYELSLHHDQKVNEDLQAMEVSLAKMCAFQDDEQGKEQMDYKDSKALDQKTLTEVPVYPLRIQKRSAKSDGSAPRPRRPLPPSPADAHRLGLQGQGSKLQHVLESKEELSQRDRIAEPNTPPPPPFSATGRPLEDQSYLQSMIPSGPSFPPNTVSQPPYNPPRQRYDPPQQLSPYPPEPHAEASYGGRVQSLPSRLPHPRSLGMRLSFDPSVAYSDLHANSWETDPSRGVHAASLYSSAVSSHMRHGSMTPGSRQSYVPASLIPNTETSRLDKTDIRSLQTPSGASSDPSASTISFSHGPRPRMVNGYEQRWASSESDIHRDVYRGGR